MASDRTGRVWEEVRRALGHFAGRAVTRALPEERFAITPTVRLPEISACGLAVPGKREADWALAAMISQCAMPTAALGSGGMDLASLPVVIASNQALGSVAPSIADDCCAISPGAMSAWDLQRDTPEVPNVHEDVVRLTASDQMIAVMTQDAPSVKTVRMLGKSLPGSERGIDWKLSRTQLRAELAPALRVPLRCEKLVSRAGVPIEQAFTAECRQLAETMQVAESDIALLGVFPHVPLAAVKRLSMSHDGNALEVWLDAERIVRAARLATVTIILGRQRSTGRVAQAIRRGANA